MRTCSYIEIMLLYIWQWYQYKKNNLWELERSWHAAVPRGLFESIANWHPFGKPGLSPDNPYTTVALAWIIQDGDLRGGGYSCWIFGDVESSRGSRDACRYLTNYRWYGGKYKSTPGRIVMYYACNVAVPLQRLDNLTRREREREGERERAGECSICPGLSISCRASARRHEKRKTDK